VRGYCLTGGLELVLGCDLLIVSDTARIADTHGRWGMSPTWGMSQRLPRRIGPLSACELMFTGREISGAEAVTIGLANRCVPDAQLDDVAVEIAEQCLGNSWHSLRSQKHLVRQGLELPLSAGLVYERTTSRTAPDMNERLGAFGAQG
jgi:enoyl-CoA hydratase/carnithine racemase